MKHLNLRVFARMLSLFVAALLLSQCIVPYESARMLPKRTVELKGAFTHVSERFDGETESVNNGVGLGVGYGVSDRVNLKFRYERVMISDSDGEGLNYLAFGPKFGLMPDKIALLFPVGVYLYEGESTWGIHPNLLFTLPGRNNRFEATFGARSDIFFEEDSEMLIGFNLGLGLSQDLDRWAIRPDFGLIFNPGEEGVILTFGLGASYNIQPR